MPAKTASPSPSTTSTSLSSSSTALWRLEQASSTTDPLFLWRANEAWGFMCQWYIMPMTDPTTDITYNSCEQYMMYRKALEFGDSEIARKILGELDPRKQKGLGQKVKGFQDEVWDRCKLDIVVRANMLKFEQGKARDDDRFVFPSNGVRAGMADVELKEVLLSTGTRELVEASPFDRIWGIGFRAADAVVQDRVNWGENLLGRALMEVRQRIAAPAPVAVQPRSALVQAQKMAGEEVAVVAEARG